MTIISMTEVYKMAYIVVPASAINSSILLLKYVPCIYLLLDTVQEKLG